MTHGQFANCPTVSAEAWEAIQRKRPDPLEGAADAVEANGGGFLEGVLPDADDCPSLLAELAGHALVPGYVVLALFIPESAVGFGSGVALWAAVPETSIHEDGDLLFGERKVGLSGQWKMPSPSGDLVALQER